MADTTSLVSGVAQRYANALFELALEDGVLEGAESDFRRFSSLVDESDDLRRLVRSPVFSADDQFRAVAAVLEKAVVESVRAKAGTVARDERESGARELLNLGHTFAHALETAAGHGDSLRHGEAVAVGLVLAFDLSVRLGHCPPDEHARLKRHLAAVGLPVAISEVAGPGWSAGALIEHMGQDKKTRRGRLRLVLARAIGDAFVCEDIEPGPLAETIDRSLNPGATAAPSEQSARA